MGERISSRSGSGQSPATKRILVHCRHSPNLHFLIALMTTNLLDLLPLSPPKGGTKRDFAIFSSKFQVLSKNVCSKVSVCENFQRQNCSYIVPLSITVHRWIACGRRPHLPKICAQSDPPPSENADFDRCRSAAAVRASEKNQLSLIGSRQRAFQ